MADINQVEQFKYPECGKGGDHVGEVRFYFILQVLNLVCLEPKCI